MAIKTKLDDDSWEVLSSPLSFVDFRLESHLLMKLDGYSFALSTFIEFVLTKSFFTYNGEYYQQIFGCAMGSPMRATITNIVM